MTEHDFVEVQKIDVSEHIEKNNNFSYLSWAYAISQLRSFDPEATWEVLRFDGAPYLKTDCGYFVEVAVTVKGITLSQIHPVLDHRNKPIEQPNSFQINTSIQRCLVKAIGLHGLGLYIYAGEDLPIDNTPPETITTEQIGELKMKVLELAQLRKINEDAVYTHLKVKDLSEIKDVKGANDALDIWIKNAKKAAAGAQALAGRGWGNVFLYYCSFNYWDMDWEYF